MTARFLNIDEAKAHKIQQTVKWTVYTLLIVNFGFYIAEDWDRAIHTLTSQSTILDWTSEFATSIDESAWFILLIMFELETYIVDDLKGWAARVVHGVRLLCYVMIAHTVYAFGMDIVDYQPTVEVEGVSNLCDLVDADVSYVYNLEYTAVNSETCKELTTETQFYWLADSPLVSTLAGLNLERDLVLADFVEAVIWLLILFSIETIVRMQDRGISGGTTMSSLNAIKIFLYLSLIALGIYWATLSHWLYLWDELVWIGGFAAIEMNISDWRDEMIEEAETGLIAGTET